MYDVLTLCRVVNAKLSQCAEFLRSEMSKKSDGQTFQCVATQKGTVRAKWRGQSYYAEQGNYFAVCTPLPKINASQHRGIQQPGQTEVARLCAEANAESSGHKPRSVKILDLMYAKLTKASKWVCDYGSRFSLTVSAELAGTARGEFTSVFSKQSYARCIVFCN